MNNEEILEVFEFNNLNGAQQATRDRFLEALSSILASKDSEKYEYAAEVVKEISRNGAYKTGLYVTLEKYPELLPFLPLSLTPPPSKSNTQ